MCEGQAGIGIREVHPDQHHAQGTADQGGQPQGARDLRQEGRHPQAHLRRQGPRRLPHRAHRRRALLRAGPRKRHHHPRLRPGRTQDRLPRRQRAVTPKSQKFPSRAQHSLMKNYPDLYPSTRNFRKAYDVDSAQHSSDSDQKSRSHSLLSSNTHEDLRADEVQTGNSSEDLTASSPHFSLHSSIQKKKNKFAEALKRQKDIKHQKKYKILVCTVQSDCIIKPLRPVFIMKNGMDAMEPFEVRKFKQSYSNLAQLDQERIVEEERDSSDESEEEESQITTQDIIHIKNAKKLGLDSITISNVHKVKDIRELREILGKECRMRVIVRITTKEAMENLEEMLGEADGCIIARGYISAQQAIESVFQAQINMIRMAHCQLKPIIVASQILESMITSLIPTFSEMGDITNLVNEDVDALMLTGETTYGRHVTQSIETLDRICRQVEANQVQVRSLNFNKRSHMTIISSKHIVSNAIAAATVDAAYRIKAKLVMVFTTTGSSALKLSKLKAPCHILAVTPSTRISRQLQLVAGITSYSFKDTNELDFYETVIKLAKRHKYVDSGDYVVIMTGQVANMSGSTNTLKIIQIQ